MSTRSPCMGTPWTATTWVAPMFGAREFQWVRRLKIRYLSEPPPGGGDALRVVSESFMDMFVAGNHLCLQEMLNGGWSDKGNT